MAAIDSDIIRPLISFSKSDILKYAHENDLSWNEDSTNKTDDYLRNRIRKQMTKLDDDIKQQLLALWMQQKYLKSQIDNEVTKLVGNGPVFPRYFFTHINESTGLECLRYIFDAKLTRPQLVKTLHAIKTSKVNKNYQAGAKIQIKFTSRNFTVELLK